MMLHMDPPKHTTLRALVNKGFTPRMVARLEPRLEIRVMVEGLRRRLPDIELAGPVDRLRSSLINGIKRMPVTFTPERQCHVVGG